MRPCPILNQTLVYLHTWCKSPSRGSSSSDQSLSIGSLLLPAYLHNLRSLAWSHPSSKEKREVHPKAWRPWCKQALPNCCSMLTASTASLSDVSFIHIEALQRLSWFMLICPFLWGLIMAGNLIWSARSAVLSTYRTAIRTATSYPADVWRQVYHTRARTIQLPVGKCSWQLHRTQAWTQSKGCWQWRYLQSSVSLQLNSACHSDSCQGSAQHSPNPLSPNCRARGQWAPSQRSCLVAGKCMDQLHDC